ncbi:MAG: fatty acid--CoA ligase family protein [Actinobacteria bacterium]|nr:MAG: fatty acid--CoA ligase family protein [Actinomycetota bacterium]
MSADNDVPRRDTIPAMTAAAAEQFGDLVAIIDGDTTLTFAELYDEALYDEARTFGAAVVASGIEPGDRVSIWAPNSVEWVIAVLGLWQAGAVLVPINTRFKGAEAADLLSRGRAKLLVTVTDFLDTDYVAMLRATGIALPDLETIVVARGKAPEGTESWAGFLARATDDARVDVARRAAGVHPEDPADILFTSGTTGRPKGVVQTHSRTLVVATDWPAMTGLTTGDKYLMVNPYFHMFGLKAGILACVSVGATMLPEPVLDVGRALQRIADEKVTCLPGAPTLFQSILEHPDRDRYDLSSLRTATIGAADIPVALIRRILDELPYRVLISGYGLTEGGTAAGTAPDDDAETIATTVGWARPTFELRLVDQGGNDVAAGEAGEIVLRGASVMLEYLDDPEATADTLSPDGWLKTGDLGQFTDAGCLRIVGRVKDMYIVGGFNAYPAEIENVLLGHPEIQQVAVIGIPDERLGEVGMAFVVLRPGSTSTADAVIAWAREQMANYKVPRAVELVEELPLNATGKVMKDALRERAVR